MARYTEETCPKSRQYFENGGQCGGSDACRNCKNPIEIGRHVRKVKPLKEKQSKKERAKFWKMPFWWWGNTGQDAEYGLPETNTTTPMPPVKPPKGPPPFPNGFTAPKAEQRQIALSLAELEMLLEYIYRQNGTDCVLAPSYYSDAQKRAWVKGFGASRERLIELMQNPSELKRISEYWDTNTVGLTKKI